MSTISVFAFPGIVFVMTVLFGYWLNKTGKPYKGWLFNLHKLIALGGVILTVIQLSKALRIVDSTTLLLVLLISAGICVLALFASGGLMSANKLDFTLMRTIHRIALVGLPIVLIFVGYLPGKHL